MRSCIPCCSRAAVDPTFTSGRFVLTLLLLPLTRHEVAIGLCSVTPPETNTTTSTRTGSDGAQGRIKSSRDFPFSKACDRGVDRHSHYLAGPPAYSTVQYSKSQHQGWYESSTREAGELRRCTNARTKPLCGKREKEGDDWGRSTTPLFRGTTSQDFPSLV